MVNSAKISILILCPLLLLACVTESARNTADKTTSAEKAQIYLKIGISYMDLNNLNVAKEKLETALKWDDNNADVHNAVAVLYERIKKLKLANQHYQTAIDLAPENYSVKNNYGRFLCDQKKYAEGLVHLTAAFKMPLNNRKWLALTNAGRCKLQQGNKRIAENYFRMALATNRLYAPALLEMQKISYHQGKYMSARAFLQRYLSIARHNAITLWYGFQTERSMGNAHLAEEYRQKLFARFPDSTQSQQLKSVTH